jgi:hypothetical protein
LIKEYKIKANIGVGLAIVVWFAGAILSCRIDRLEDSFLLFHFLSLIPLTYGCCCYSKGKGHFGIWGIVGFLWIPGLLILACFKDRCKITTEVNTKKADDAMSKEET